MIKEETVTKVITLHPRLKDQIVLAAKIVGENQSEFIRNAVAMRLQGMNITPHEHDYSPGNPILLDNED